MYSNKNFNMSYRSDSGRRHKAAFTLVEILMALAISALLLSGAAVAISVASQTMDVNRHQGDFSQLGRMILGRMAREVRNADAVQVSAGVLSIIPPAGSNVELCEYLMSDGSLIYRQTISGVVNTHSLVGLADEVSVSAFTLSSETATRDSVVYTSAVNIRLTLSCDGDSVSLTSSACPRRNLSW